MLIPRISLVEWVIKSRGKSEKKYLRRCLIGAVAMVTNSQQGHCRGADVTEEPQS